MIYGYIRISTDKQETENQKFEIKRFAEKSNLVVDEWVEETLSSRVVLEKRLLHGLLKKMKTGDTMIASELSRLGRNLMQIMSILHGCLIKDVQVWTIKDNYRLGNDISSKVLAFAFGLSAEIERNLISQRTKEALQRKKSEGMKLGRPVGARTSGHKLDEHTERIKRWIDQQYSYSLMARKLKCHRLTVSKFVIQKGFKNKKIATDAQLLTGQKLRKKVDVSEAVALYKSGKSLTEIAAEFQISHARLTEKLIEQGFFNEILQMNRQARIDHPSTNTRPQYPSKENGYNRGLNRDI
jgi:DNA invertase Pin-like site-specific DNA recombinase